MNAIVLYRLGNWLHVRRVPVLPRVVHRTIFLLFNCSIPPETEIGEGCWLGYGGMGVVIHPQAKIGRNVFFGPQVTVGGRSGHVQPPVIGDDVYLSAGARVLGPIRVGRGAVIGANAVVIHDVPDHGVVAGVPARLLRIDPDARA